MARAPALQAGGQGFDSLILHMPLSGRRFFDRMEGKTRKTIKRRRARALRKNTSQELGYTESRRRDAADGRGTRQVPKGARRMPWLPEAKKDAEGCEKPRGGANGL